MKNSNYVIVISGPTACGKSALAMDLAIHYNGCIINADSLQLYEDLQILTARPSAEDLKKIPHKLYGILNGNERFSVARWLNMALYEVNKARQQHLQPIIVGGSGLYVQALLQGIANVPKIPQEILQGVVDELEHKGLKFLYRALSKEDPLMAQKLHPNDRQRITRALSVIRATGKSLSIWHEQEKKTTTDETFLRVLMLPDREKLYHLADQRFDQMIEEGALQEVADLLQKGYPHTAPIFKALGVFQLREHLENHLSLEEAVKRAKTATRHYIKRQLTWFRGQFQADVTLSFPYNCSNLSSIIELINKDQYF